MWSRQPLDSVVNAVLLSLLADLILKGAIDTDNEISPKIEAYETHED